MSLMLRLLYWRVGIIFPGDFQALHFGLQRRTFQSQTVSGAFRTGKNSMGFSQDSDDMPSLYLIEVVFSAAGFGSRGAA